jgi:hypothetical protein
MLRFIRVNKGIEGSKSHPNSKIASSLGEI